LVAKERDSVARLFIYPLLFSLGESIRIFDVTPQSKLKSEIKSFNFPLKSFLIILYRIENFTLLFEKWQKNTMIKHCLKYLECGAFLKADNGRNRTGPIAALFSSEQAKTH
jgi:hypothetical protein